MALLAKRDQISCKVIFVKCVIPWAAETRGCMDGKLDELLAELCWLHSGKWFADSYPAGGSGVQVAHADRPWHCKVCGQGLGLDECCEWCNVVVVAGDRLYELIYDR